MMTVSGQHFLKIEADDNKLGHVANAVKNKTKRIIEDFKNQGFFLLPISHLKLVIVSLFAKCAMHINLKMAVLMPFLYLEIHHYVCLLLHS